MRRSSTFSRDACSSLSPTLAGRRPRNWICTERSKSRLRIGLPLTRATTSAAGSPAADFALPAAWSAAAADPPHATNRSAPKAAGASRRRGKPNDEGARTDCTGITSRPGDDFLLVLLERVDAD